jgi:hypothetical protein
MHMFKVALAASSMATLTLAVSSGTIEMVNEELDFGMIKPDISGGNYRVALFTGVVCHI